MNTNSESSTDIITISRSILKQALDSINELFAAEQSEGGERGGHIRTPATREHLVRVAQARKALHESCGALRAALAQPEPTVPSDCADSHQPVQEPGDFDHGIGADRFKVVRGAFWGHVLIGDSPTEHGKFHSRASAEKMAADLLREFRNGAFVQYEAALAQQAEPLNLRDPAVQKRLATQWGYVPAAQAEPVQEKNSAPEKLPVPKEWYTEPATTCFAKSYNGEGSYYCPHCDTNAGSVWVDHAWRPTKWQAICYNCRNSFNE